MPTGAAGTNMYGLNGRGHAYWTGALYFLLAHVELSERGQGDGLFRCIRAMRSAGDASVRGSVDALIQLCAAAVGAPVLADIRRRFADPADLDLTALWRCLGVNR
jgi:hypothetical protein